MNTNYMNIERSEYDRLKRCEIALEILYRNTFRDGMPTYISREDESAFMLVYGKEIDELKNSGQTTTAPAEVPQLPQFPQFPNEVTC